MKLSNHVYDTLKWLVIVVIPALATAYVGLSAIWGWPLADEVAKTASVICVLIGSIIGISSVNYNKGNKEQDNG